MAKEVKAKKDAKEKKEKDVKKVKKTESKKVDKKKKTEKVKKEGLAKGIKKEMKLVKWPTAKEIFKYTIATVVFCVVLVAFFEVLNLILAFIKGLFN